MLIATSDWGDLGDLLTQLVDVGALLADHDAVGRHGLEGRTAYIHADLRSPGEILSSPVVREVLDFSQPVALMLVGTLHFLEDKDEPELIIDTLLGALPPGSYLTASHLNPEHDPAGVAAGVRAYQAGGVTVQARDSSEFAALAFRDLELVPPGVVSVSEWRPEPTGPRPTLAEVSCYGGVGRKR